MKTKTCLTLLAAAFFAALPSFAQDYDVVIHNGRVIDPETKLDAVRSVGIRDGRIAAIAEQPLTGKKSIDAKGLVVAPGFIDLHSHAVNTLAGARMQVMDGVTTALELESGVIPVAKSYDATAREGRPLNYGFAVAWTFARAIVAKGTRVEEFSPANWADAYSRSDWHGFFPPEKSRRVLELIEQGLSEGAIGVGANLGYMPEANLEEFLDIGKLTLKYGRCRTFVHIRHNEPFGPNNNIGGHQEVIAVAAMTGAALHFCHLNSNATQRIPQMIAAVETAQRQGLDITWEVYPYGAASTMVSAAYLAPDNLPNLGIESKRIFYLQTGESVVSNERLAEIIKKDPAGLVVVHLLEETNPKEKAMLDQAVTHPTTAIASDALMWQVGANVIQDDVWPLPANASGHPRSAGTFCRVLGPYVREGKLTLHDAIRKMTLVPAQILETSVPQMKNKGRLKVDADADITIFDAAIVTDRATYNKPNQTSFGIRHVLVNGIASVTDGELVKESKAGRPVRRPTVAAK